MLSWLVVGCGYTGMRLSRRLLLEGCKVFATRQSEAACRQVEEEVPGVSCLQFSFGDTCALPECDAVVVLSPPASPGAEAVWAKSLADSVRLVYVSTTGVYPHAAGADVDDDYPVSPASPRGAKRLAVEQALVREHTNTRILRAPGIYGPGRGVHARMLAGTYRLIGGADTLVSRIHVDDLVSAIVLLGRTPSPPRSTFVCGDELPTSSREHALGVAARLGIGAPPTVDPEDVSEDVRAMLGGDRKVIPRALHQLGWRAQYPTWREGLEQALAEEGLPRTRA